MTAAAGAHRRLGPFSRAARWMSHYSMWFAGWLILTNVASRYTNQWSASAQWALTAAWFFTALLPLLVSYYGEQVHLRAWDCPTCVARTPILHGTEVAARRDTRLRWIHSGHRVRAYMVASLVVFVGAPWLITSDWNLLTGLPFYWVWIYTCLSGETHRNVAPWCPYCRGGDVPVDVVPPTPVGEKVT